MSFADFAVRPAPEPLRSKFTAALVAASAIVALYIGRPIFVPLSLALLIAFALAPVVDALRRFKIKPLPAVLATVILAASVLASVALFLAGQFAELAESGPHAANPLFEALHQPRIAASLVEPLLNPLTSAGAAVLFAAFLLLHREGIAKRFARFAASHDGEKGGAHVAAASRAFGRHLLTQGLLDLTFGAAIASGLWLAGVPNFGLWALLGVMLRSVPFVGVPVAALCPLMLADKLDPTALLVCETLLLFLGVDGALGLIERKWLRPSTVRLSAFAAVSATALWTCLWGLTGLLLAMPLTLGIVMLGRRFEALRFLDRLLAPWSRDPGAASVSWFDSRPRDAALARSDAAMRALAAAQGELGTAALDRDRVRKAIDGTVSHLAPAILPPEDRTSLAHRAPDWQGVAVLCIAGPGIMDEAAAGLLAEALKRKGLGARVVSFEETMPADLPRLALRDARAVCFSCLDARDAPVLRQLVRRVRPRARGASMIAGLWGWEGGALMDAGTVECDLITTRLNEAADRIERLAREAGEARVQAA